MRQTLIIILFIVASIPPPLHAEACVGYFGYEAAELLAYPFNEDFAPPRVDVAVLKLERGVFDPTPQACASTGILTIVASDRPHPDVAGYSFRVRSGSFPGSLPDRPVIPIELKYGQLGFQFAWRDLAKGQRKTAPIDATIEVRLVSHNGKEGEPLLLHIMHPGG